MSAAPITLADSCIRIAETWVTIATHLHEAG